MQAALLVAGIGLLARVVAQAAWTPALWPDSQSYLDLARALAAGDLSSDSGLRPPGYSLLLLAAGLHLRTVTILQAALGLGTALLIFCIVLEMTGTVVAAAIAGGVVALDPSALLFESNILSETLAGFVVAATVYATLRAERARSLAWATAAGMLASSAAWTRPVFGFLGPAMVGMLVIARRARNSGKRVGLGAACLLPWLVLVGGLCAWNQSRLGTFGLSTMAGYNLMNHAIGFVDDAPPRFEPLRHILVEERDRKIRRTGSAVGTVWRAEASMRAETGMTRPQLSRRLTEMSLVQCARHPMAYAASVGRSFAVFWLPAPYHVGFTLHTYVNRTEPAWVYVYSAVYLVGMAAFLLFVLLLVARADARRDLAGPGVWMVWTVLAVIFCDAFLSSLVEFGEGARYKQPVEGLIIGLTVHFLWRTRSSRHRPHADGSRAVPLGKIPTSP